MHDPGTDPLSSLAKKIIDIGSYRELVVTGEKSAASRDLLENIAPDQLLAVPVKNPAAAYAMLAALWLRHDALNACHEIVQKSPGDLHHDALNLHSKASKTGLNVIVESVENAKVREPRNLREMAETLAFWHAIMHRREGDFSNSRYWYARCQNHPSLPAMAAAASKAINAMPADKSLLRVVATGWNPNGFVDLVQAVHDKPNDPRHALAVALQRMEWQVLFDHCTRVAAGR